MTENSQNTQPIKPETQEQTQPVKIKPETRLHSQADQTPSKSNRKPQFSPKRSGLVD